MTLETLQQQASGSARYGVRRAAYRYVHRPLSLRAHISCARPTTQNTCEQAQLAGPLAAAHLQAQGLRLRRRPNRLANSDPPEEGSAPLWQVLEDAYAIQACAPC